MKKTLAFFLVISSLNAFADKKNDLLGERILFGAKGNVIQDQYGDVQVIKCASGKWLIIDDPNRCGRALANGAFACTELAVMYSGPWSNTFKGGNHYLVNKESGEKKVIKSEGESTYSMQSFRGSVKLKKAKPLKRSELIRECAEINDVG